MSWNPFNDFPFCREIGIPSRIGLVNSMSEFIQKINCYNTKTTVFTSLYAFDQTSNNRGVYSSARIKQIYFDLDTPKDMTSLLNFHNYLERKNLIHCINFSGGGFHIYVGIQFPNDLKNKKAAVGNAQIALGDELQLKIGINGDSDIDGHIIGNIAQLVRVPGTYNLKRKLYCIPLTHKDLDLPLEKIKEKAKTQHFGVHVFGKEFLDLSKFDSESILKKYEDTINLENSGDVDSDKVNISTFPPCIKEFMKEKQLKHRWRYVFMLYCRELGLPLGATIKILRQFLDHATFHHCVFQERQIFWVFRRTDLTFPSCLTLINEGVCKSNDCKGINLYN